MPDKVQEAVESIKKKVNIQADTGLILGSGLGELAHEIENPAVIKYSSIPNFPVSTVKGHRGELVSGILSGANVIVMSGRVHYYEGLSMRRVSFPVEVLAGCGVKKLIITNAGGGVNREYAPGDIVAITDHINLMGDNPLKGSADFIDMTHAYDPEMRKIAEDAAVKTGIKLKEGVYAAMSGPSYETPAEVRMIKAIGGDIAGMSTIPEVIMAKKYGMKVLGLSMITNMAAGITGNELSHKEVIETSKKSISKFKKLLREIISNIWKCK